MKSKMPCPPGLVPVANVDQATGVWAGRVVPTRVKPPRSASRARLGKLASREQSRNDSGLQSIQTNDDDLLDGSVLDVQSCIAERPVTRRPTKQITPFRSIGVKPET